MINYETHPPHKVEIRKFDWGVPYNVITPIFDLDIDKNLSDIEFSIELYGRNNIKGQLIRLLNKLVNYEENEFIQNFEGTINNREELVEKLRKYWDINQEKKFPWDEFGEDFNTELCYVFKIEKQLGRKLLYIEIE